MGKHKKTKLKRPLDKLPPEKLREAWSTYLDNAVGRQGARPRWEVLVDPKKMDKTAYEALQELERTTRTSRAEVYVKALENVIDKLPANLQNSTIKRYFGIGWPYPQTQEEIADALGITQPNIARRIERGMKNLRVLVRRELPNVVREELGSMNDGML